MRRARRVVIGLAGCVLALAVETVILLQFRDDLAPGTIALLMLPPVLVAATGGLRSALLGAAVGALTFNFFFSKPYSSFRIEAEESIAAFAIYLGVGAVLGVIVGYLRQARALADRRAQNVALLQELTTDMIRTARFEPAAQSALARTTETLSLVGSALSVKLHQGAVAARSGDATRCLAAVEALGAERLPGRPAVHTLRDERGIAVFPIATPEGALGVLLVDHGSHELEADRERFLQSLAGVIALAASRDGFEHERFTRRSLEETDRLRTALFQSVSHDLRTPLTAIRSMVGALRADPGASTSEAMVEGIDEEAARLTDLVESMLDLSRIESGTLEVRRLAITVDDLIWGAVEAASTLDREALSVTIADDLPPLRVDETMIRQVLVNLLENAAIHGEPARGVSLTARLAGDSVRISVADHGHGVPEAERRRIFEPYLRLRPHDSRPTGSGLGLAICQGYVEAHGGRIRVETTPGGGATFTVVLPVSEPA